MPRSGHAAVRRDHPNEIADPRPTRDRRDVGYVHTAYLDVHVFAPTRWIS